MRVWSLGDKTGEEVEVEAGLLTLDTVTGCHGF
jgi:hypothetical protein